MIIEKSDKIIASLRRKFSEEYARFFIGTVEGAEDGVIRVAGRVWVWDPYRQNVVVREGERCKLIALASDQFIVHVLDREEDLEALNFTTDSNGKIWLARGETPYFELSERAATGH
ncbi:MAG: hypothetical protein ACYTG2_13395 [Planctomycetota bacterium]|jgi:hypothetical protein